VVTWAPVRIQYTLSRYIGLGAYGFGIVAEDQYGRANSAQKNIFPVFGTVRFFNSRLRYRGDSSSDVADAIRGRYITTGNTDTSRNSAFGFERFAFSYIPFGVSNDGLRREYVDPATTVTYGSDLFGNASAGGPGAIAVPNSPEGSAPFVSIPVAGNGGAGAGTSYRSFGNNFNVTGISRSGSALQGMGASRALGAILPATSSSRPKFTPKPPVNRHIPSTTNNGWTRVSNSFGLGGDDKHPLPTTYQSAWPDGLYSAGSWHTVDGQGAGRAFVGYSPNPIQEQLNPSTRATGVVGTPGGYSGSPYIQFRGGTPEAFPGRPNVEQVQVTPSGIYSDNEAQARVIPSNSPYLFSSVSAIDPLDLNNGLVAPRADNTPFQGMESAGFQSGGNHRPDYAMPRYFAGKVQSEIDYHQVVPGRPSYYSAAAGFSDDIANVAVGGPEQNAGGRLRLSFTWPTIITNTAPGYPAAGGPNLFNETDVMQMATPNLAMNGRVFFTGNYPTAANEYDYANNYFGLLGYPTASGLTWTTQGVSASTDASAGQPVQPIHTVTNGVWIPNNANFHFNFPNAYTTPAGGSGYTDIPFTGIAGYQTRMTRNGQDFYNFGTDLNLDNTPGDYNWLRVGLSGVFTGLNPSHTAYDNANPVLVDTTSGDRTHFVWMKKDEGVNNAYGAWAGSMLTGGAASVTAKGGLTTAPHFTMANGTLTDTQAQISFAELNGQLGAANQPLASSTGIVTGWNRSQFELLRNVIGAPAQFGLASRVKLTDPTTDDAAPYTSEAIFDVATPNTVDGLMQNSLVVYALRDRGTKTTQNGSTYSSLLGEAGLEPGAPVLAQWWNTGNGDVAAGSFPDVIKAYSNNWLTNEFTEVVHINHNFIGKAVNPWFRAFLGPAAPVMKHVLQIGLIAPKGHDLLNNGGQGVKPVVTPVRQLAINDMVTNFADGNPAGNVGTKLDIFNGDTYNLFTGAPYFTAPSYKLADGNATGAADFTLNGFSNVQLTWQPAVNDLRQPSGYIITIYSHDFGGIYNDFNYSTPIREIRVGHLGGIGAKQTLVLPPFAVMDTWLHGIIGGLVPPGFGPWWYYVKVRNVWMEGNEGAAGHSFDMGKAPFAVRYPMAYADTLSGTFTVSY
jgi:hypothetical protein